MDYEKITWALNDDGVARIAMNDPATRNAATGQMGEELLHALGRASREARAVLLTGEANAFCSGANLTQATGVLSDPDRDFGDQLNRVFNPVLLAMRDMKQPIVTAIPGAAAGVGAGFAMAGDLIVCGESGFFLQAFCHVGLIPDGGSTWLLAKAVGRVRAMELMLLGERIHGPKALEWGLVTRCVPDDEVESTAMALARQMAKGPASLGMIKQLAWAASDSSFERALAAERIGQREAGRTEDFIEGVSAFAQKRKPEFKGR